MADEQAQVEQAAKKPPLKVIAVVAVMMILEGLGVFLFVSATGRAPQDTMAVEGQQQALMESNVEIPLVEGKFQNMLTGRAWIWSVEIYLKVKRKNEARVNEILEARQAEIRESVSQLIRRADHSHLKEPDLRTLNRQFTALANEVFGYAEADGLPRVERVIIAKCQGHQVN